MGMDNSQAKNSLRRIIRRLEVLREWKSKQNVDEEYEAAILHLRRIIIKLVDDRRHPLSLRNKVLQAYADSRIEVKDIAERYGVNLRTIYHWASEEKLPYRRWEEDRSD